MKINIGITPKTAEKVTGLLNKLLADEYILLTKTRNYHWHVFGPSFMEMHKFYEGQYERLRNIIDELAERVTQLGYSASATLREFLELTRLKEGAHIFEAPPQVKQLLSDHETMCRQIRSDISHIEEKIQADDPVTVDMLTDFLTTHEKMAWTLRSYLGHAVAVTA